jgi:hypothetical protein
MRLTASTSSPQSVSQTLKRHLKHRAEHHVVRRILSTHNRLALHTPRGAYCASPSGGSTRTTIQEQLARAA